VRTALIIGSGKRVREAALPAFLAAGDRYRIGGVYSRTQKRIEAAGRAFDVAPLAQLDTGALAGVDLVYLCVAKHAVPAVLGALARLDVSGTALLIDTPVLRFRDLGHLRLIERFRAAWVAEDCSVLPCFDAIAAARAALGLGAVRRVVLDRSAYAYHGIAMGRALLGEGRVRRARRASEGRDPRGEGDRARRTVVFEDGGELAVLEPRDYALGRIRVECERGAIADDPGHADATRLAAVVEDGACTGFSVGATRIALDPAERELLGRRLLAGAEGVTVWMEGMKRAGFLRLLRSIDAGEGAYPLERALEDTVVDYHLERLGLYFANPLTSPHFASARLALRLVTRFAGS
jgi:hypothetical protein